MDLVSIQQTGDGSPTLYSEKFKATYHSSHGALTESNIVFIQSGLDFISTFPKSEIRIFEMGFGSGFNTHLTYLWNLDQKRKISYTGIEAYPIEKEAWQNYAMFFKNNHPHVFEQWHTLSWNERHDVSENFTFTKILDNIEHHALEMRVDLIYFDAFGPNTQPELWQEDILLKMYTLLEETGVLVTYCAKGEFKRTLKKLGFKVEALPGPPGKREIVRAIKTVSPN